MNFPVFLFDLAQQVVQFRGVLFFEQALNEPPCLGEPPGEKVSQRQIVAVVVGRRVDALRPFEKRERIGDLSGLNVELAQIMVGEESPRFQIQRLAELLSGQFGLPGMRKARRQIGSGRR